MDDLSNEFVEVVANDSAKTLSVKFLGFVPAHELVPILEYEYELIEHYGLEKCYIDLRSVPIYGQGSKDYVRDVWFPRVSRLGVRSVAFVVPEAVLGNMSMKDAHKEADAVASLTVRHFSEPVEARSWLLAA